MAYTKYSLTPANNNAAPPDGAPEGMLPSAVNDTMRDMMAQIRDVGDGIRNGTYTMTAPVITGGSISGSTINNSAIGGTTANSGAFTTLSASGVATFSAGTVSAPAITTTGDTNTGIFFPAADTIAFTEGGVEGMRIASTGNVGIGTTSPADKLTVVVPSGAVYTAVNNGTVNNLFGISGGNLGYFGTTTNHGFACYTNGAERMRIESGGNVGIGTSSPAFRLAVASSLAAVNTNGESSIHLVNSTSNVYLYNSFASNAVGLYDGTSERQLMNFNRATETWSFSTSATERLIINSSGNVGIGMSPGVRFDISGNARLGNTTTTPNLTLNNTSSGSWKSELIFANSSVNKWAMGVDILSNGNNNFYWYDSAASAERMRIDSSGRVGINTTTFSTGYLTIDTKAQSGIDIYRSDSTAQYNGIRFRNTTNGSTYGSLGWDSGGLRLDGDAGTMYFSTSGTERMRITSGGDLLVGTSSAFLGSRTNFLNASAGQIAMRHSGQTAGQYWYMGSESSAGVFIIYSDTTGGVYMTRGATAWTGNSDEKLKNITGEIQNGLEKVCSLRAAQFTWKSDKENKPQVGLIAQDVQKVLPEVIDTNGDGHLGIRYTDTIPLLVAAIKEQQIMIEELKQEVALLKSK